MCFLLGFENHLCSIRLAVTPVRLYTTLRNIYNKSFAINDSFCMHFCTCRTEFDHAPDPAAALAAIEAETGDVNTGASRDALKRLRQLLEREIEAQVRRDLWCMDVTAVLVYA